MWIEPAGEREGQRSNEVMVEQRRLLSCVGDPISQGGPDCYRWPSASNSSERQGLDEERASCGSARIHPSANEHEFDGRVTVRAAAILSRCSRAARRGGRAEAGQRLTLISSRMRPAATRTNVRQQQYQQRQEVAPGCSGERRDHGRAGAAGQGRLRTAQRADRRGERQSGSGLTERSSAGCWR